MRIKRKIALQVGGGGDHNVVLAAPDNFIEPSALRT